MVSIVSFEDGCGWLLFIDIDESLLNFLFQSVGEMPAGGWMMRVVGKNSMAS